LLFRFFLHVFTARNTTIFAFPRLPYLQNAFVQRLNHSPEKPSLLPFRVFCIAFRSLLAKEGAFRETPLQSGPFFLV
jgi:hypothetical protein